MVKDGKRMWKEMVKANWMRERRSGSSSGIVAMLRLHRACPKRGAGLTESNETE
jgi:hypothetical protein